MEPDHGGRWAGASAAYAAADSTARLGPEDVTAWARAEYMLGRDEAYVDLLTRAHRDHLERDQPRKAAECAWWIGHNLLFRGLPGPANGWFSVGNRLLSGVDCPERGYLLAPVWLQQLGRGQLLSALATLDEAVRLGEAHDDPDLLWLSRDDRARCLLMLGRVEEALDLVDELLVVVESGEISPVVRGIIYCNTIAFCRDAHQQRHAREWTQALTAWCERQPEMVAHNGLCLVHRAEVLQLLGRWASALTQARRAAERFTAGALNEIAHGQAHYRQAEIHRLQGRWALAEAGYMEASRFGRDPQPGLALTRLGEGRVDLAAAAIRRAVLEVTDPSARATLLPAYVEITVAVGDLGAAEAGCRELSSIAESHRSESLRAARDHARALVAEARGDHPEALVAARAAWQAWQGLEAPYDAARARVVVARACRHLGDNDSADLEEAAARQVFRKLGAAPELADPTAPAGGLSKREIEVLRLVSDGRTNREIAQQLVISERTVARHLQNIYTKLEVSTRTAASAFAHEHGLVRRGVD